MHLLTHWRMLTALCVGGLLLGNLNACTSLLKRGHPASAYRVEIPTLEATPSYYTCQVGTEGKECVALLAGDFADIVEELKAACIALGGERKDCAAGN